MSKILTLTRAVTQSECPWLDADLPAGTQVWTYEHCTYGVIGAMGVAVTAKMAEYPFFEIPLDAIGRESV